METKLYVGNLPYRITEEELKTLFSQAGTVQSVSLIKDRFSGESKGFGFVEMSNQAEVEKAVRMFNEYTMENRQIKVNIARPREDRGPGGGGGGGFNRRGDSSNRGGPRNDRRGGPGGGGKDRRGGGGDRY